jgi:pimeloyl-ACP methyl ester carboxylesterase
VRQVEAGPLNVGYVDVGTSTGQPVVLLHGWPYDIHAFADSAAILGATGYRVVVPFLRGYGSTRFPSDDTMRNGQQSALAVDVIDLMGALHIESAIVAGFDWGARSANAVAALWPQRCNALVSVSGYLIGNPEVNQRPLRPAAELSWWYQFYFATERGRAGYDQFRHDFAKLIWHTASPQWSFSDDTFERTAGSFDNPDHVSIVVHNYRWRLGLAPGEPRYDETEHQLATSPVIGVPTITLEGDANGAPHPDPATYVTKFARKYLHQTIAGGVGHNLPQEAPEPFAHAVMEADTLSS